MYWIKKTIFCFLLLLLTACQQQQLQIGAQAPSIQAKNLTGNIIDLTAWRGKYIYLNFWSATCGPCMAEMPILDRLSQEFKDKLVVVGINTDEEQRFINKFLVERQISYPIVLDQLGISQARYQVQSNPTSFLIDNNGKLLQIHVGMLSEQQLREELAKAWNL